MATNLAIDDNLLRTALVIGGLKTKKDTVNLALDEFIQRRKRQEVINLFGKIEFDKNLEIGGNGIIPISVKPCLF